ncbi:MAG TPA: ABC transporter permease [Terriglobia bacterium]|jgi:ABC-type antimicrobial peptide transport system permease subunit|nr:ABC transporter permease [Terriglobia bacterium]
MDRLYRKHIRENLLLALDTLRTHKFRSFLTVLGVLIGTMTVIAVASVFAGLDKQVADAAKDFGTRTLFIFKFQVGLRFRLSREERLRKPLTYEDARAIQEECPAVETVAVEKFIWWGPPPSLKYKGMEMLDYNFLGATPNDFSVVNDNLGDGRFFTDVDNLHRRNVAVIGADIVKRFFSNEDPIGKSLIIGSESFEIVGTILPRKSFPGDTGTDRVVKIPYNTFRRMYPNEKENFILAMAYPGKVDEAIDEISGLLRRRRRDKPSEPDSFGVTTAESVINRFREIMSTVVVVTVIISSIGLLVGGIGVMNIMLVSVTERTREIGVRKAIGARRSDITWQFLLEAMTLTGAGGVMGILGGCALSLFLRTFVPSLPSSVPAWSVAAGFVLSVSIGLFFGLWPAVKAARLDPIAALRYE